MTYATFCDQYGTPPPCHFLLLRLLVSLNFVSLRQVCRLRFLSFYRFSGRTLLYFIHLPSALVNISSECDSDGAIKRVAVEQEPFQF